MPANTLAVVGLTKRFECRVIGHPRPEIRWFKDGRDITHNKRYSFDQDYEGVISMVIEDVHHVDEGHYRCRAENTEGFASTSAYLIVKPHMEHPDEEIEEVHAMQLDEHFVYKTKKVHTIIVDNDDEMEVETARKRTFEQIVVEEKTSNREAVNGTTSLSFSSRAEESSYSKKNTNGYENSSFTSSKKVNSSAEEESVSKIVTKSTKFTSLKTESVSEDMVKPSSKLESESVSSSEQITEQNSFSVSSSVEHSTFNSCTESEGTVIGVSVETELSSSSFSSEKESGSALSLKTSVEHSEQIKELKVSVEMSGAESTSFELFNQGTLSETGKESSQEKKSITDMKVEEVPEECQLHPLGSEGSGEQPSQDMTDNAPTSMCNDSGFLETSMLESSQFQNSMDSTFVEEQSMDRVTVSSEEIFRTVNAAVKKDECQVEVPAANTIEPSVEDISETTIVKAVVVRTETTLSQEITYIEEVSGDTPNGGDITGLLDEKPDTVTLTEDQAVVAADEDHSSRGRWVDQVTTKTDTITIEGEGKKVEELKMKEPDSAGAEVKKESQAQLHKAAVEDADEASVKSESLAKRQTSVVNEIQVTEEETAVLRVDPSKKKKGSYESKVEVDEGNSAQRDSGLQREPPLSTEEIGESSVDGFEADRGAATAAADGTGAPRILLAPEDVTVVLGEAIRLFSQVQGSPVPEVKWFKAGDTVKAGERITLTTSEDVYTLEITDASKINRRRTATAATIEEQQPAAN